MGAHQTLTHVQMFTELVNKGLLFRDPAPGTYLVPTVYQYIPTHVVYSSTADKNAELEPSTTGNKEKAG